MENNKSIPRFEIAAAVVFRLGEELITDVVQALVELVKNSYDADASWAHVTISTPSVNAKPGTSEAAGGIVIEDDGHGMDAKDFENGWLMIADSVKKRMKDVGITTGRMRTPVGDKGLGRLGVQRLGHNVEIVSRKGTNTEEICLKFSWSDFLEKKRLSDVPVQLEKKPRSKKRTGTQITIRNLKDPEQWMGDGAKSKLQRSLAELISPFKEVRDFTVTVSLDGEDVPITEVAERFRESASVRYKLNYDGKCFFVDGNVRLDFVERLKDKKDQALLKRLLRKDEGRSFFDYLIKEETQGKPPQIEFHEDSKRFVSFRYHLDIADMGGVRNVFGEIANPGAFHGEVDYLMLDSTNAGDHVWDSLGDYRQHVAELAGIRVYRDGFGVRLGEDWLKLGQQSTSGGSYYVLRPKNVIGFIAISANNNRTLLETTSREGFQKTPHFENFYGLLQHFVKCSGLAQEYLRRGALNYLKANKTSEAGIEIGNEISSATDKLREQAESIDRKEKEFKQLHGTIKNLTNNAKSRVEELTANDDQFSLYHQEKLNKLNSLISELESAISQFQVTVEELQPEVKTIAKAQQILDVILERDERLRQELEMFYEGVALGLTAEMLSHEIATIADRLAKKASSLSGYLSKQDLKDPKTLGFVENVKSSVNALRKQLSHLDPSLRYVREKREIVDVVNELEVIRKFYKDRFSNHSISLLVQNKSKFDVRINRGKFNQILDNLLLNSEYWLREMRRKEPSFSGEIVIEVDRPFIRIWDNGPGISLSVEDNLFDPFVTTKEQGKGRGLGLFIVQQLLDVEGCTLSLLPERNDMGRRYKFEIDLRGGLK